jgi:hypothetical protein
MKLLITTLLLKIEATNGVDSNPTGAANAVLLRGNPTLNPLEATEDQRNSILPYFGNMGSMPSAAFGQLDFEMELAGSGTAGTPPAYGPVLRACGLSETILAAPVAGSAQVGGTITSIVLAAAASAVNNFYSGMPISITAGTGAGQSGIIVDYNGATKTAIVASSAWVAPDATSAYSIGANVAYRPITQALESVTMYFNIDGVQHKFLGVRGTATIPQISADKLPTSKVSLTGVYVPVVDGASPAVVLTGWQRPLIANAVNTSFFSLHGYNAAALDSLSMDLANVIAKVSRPGIPQRVDITNRKPAGSVSMEAVHVAAHDWFGDCRAATPGPLALTHGTVAGNIFSLSAPAVVLKAPKYSDSNGTAMIGMTMDVTPIDGGDEFAFVTY